ncbi:helix-turn-helix domain-containing protein [uncultured Litoreibacter sp.]|uniref:helix-turn-helix domain-containing protein n=1 Tax=uncultured Litoreibacter sp. TaxID=1392394 RepID=UPI00262379E2|nr:helix-turn-helix domain-containing protein [uncultured Litoreibacter sp.]
MSLKENKNPKTHMRPSEAAAYTGVSESHLNKLRLPANRGKGPTYSKPAGCIIYTRANLDEWVAENRVTQAA